jgi:hypothetical protein
VKRAQSAVLLFDVAVGKSRFRNTHHTSGVHLRAAVHDALATDRQRMTDEMAILGTHPYKRSSGSPRVFPTATDEFGTGGVGDLPADGGGRRLPVVDP